MFQEIKEIQDFTPAVCKVVGSNHARMIYQQVYDQASAEGDEALRICVEGFSFIGLTQPNPDAFNKAKKDLQTTFDMVWSVNLYDGDQNIDPKKQMVIAHLEEENGLSYKIVLSANDKRTLSSAWDGGMLAAVEHLKSVAMSVAAQSTNEFLTLPSANLKWCSPWVKDAFDFRQVTDTYIKLQLLNNPEPLYCILEKSEQDNMLRILFMSGEPPKTKPENAVIVFDFTSGLRNTEVPLNGMPSSVWKDELKSFLEKSKDNNL